MASRERRRCAGACCGSVRDVGANRSNERLSLGGWIFLTAGGAWVILTYAASFGWLWN